MRAVSEMPGRRLAIAAGSRCSICRKDMVAVRADAAALADFQRHRPADDIARGEILGRRRIALHEALALRIGEIAAFAAHPLGDQAAGAVDAGRVELHEFHILARHAGAQGHGVAVAGLGVGAGAGKIDAAVAAGRQHGLVRAEAVDGAVVQVPGDHAQHLAVLDQQVDGEIFDEELGVVAQALLIQRVQDGVAGPVGGGAGALRDALAEIGRHAAEGALVDLAVRRPAEGHAVMLQLDDRRDRFLAHIFDGVLVAQPVGALDGVVHVPAPVVVAHIAERGGDAALGRNGVGAGREDLGDAGGAQALFGHAEGRAQAGAAGADDHDVILVFDDLVGFGHSSSFLSPRSPPYAPKASLRTEIMAIPPNRSAANFAKRIRPIFQASVWT